MRENDRSDVAIEGHGSFRDGKRCAIGGSGLTETCAGQRQNKNQQANEMTGLGHKVSERPPVQRFH